MENLSVLYVEDDMMSRTIMDFMFTRDMQLPHVTIWEDSSNFEQKARQLEPVPNIVFLDIHVQPIDGLEMLKILRGIDAYNETMIVAMTASVMNEEIQILRDTGFDGAIGKPVDQTLFPQLFERILTGENIWRIIQ